MEVKDSVGAALFHAQDLREAIESLNVNSCTKNDIKSEVTVWRNSAAIIESLLTEMLTKCE